MRIIAACVLASMLVACADQQPKAFVANAAQNDAIEQYTLCLIKAAQATDDHISDAATIGLAILPMCAAAHQRAMDAMTQNVSLDAKVMFLRKEDAHRLELATAIVLKSRQHRTTP
jgi:hypothetical protein